MFELSSRHEAALNAWISTMDGGSPVSTYQGSYDVPFQRWFKFKEAFSPLLVKRLIEESSIPVRRCTDVFGGCGTSALTSIFLGVEPTIVEVNPFLVDVIRAKLDHYDVQKVCRSYMQWRRTARSLEKNGVAIPGSFPESFVEKRGLEQWVYPKDVMARLIAYRAALGSIRDANIRRLFRVLLGAVLVEVSNVVVNGKGRKYRTNWESRQKKPRDVDAELDTRTESVVYDLARFVHRPKICSNVIHADARVALGAIEQSDIYISSPPYPNSFDYTDIYNLELWVLGYIRNRTAELKLRRSTIRSHVQRKLIHQACLTESPTLRRILRRLRGAQVELWHDQIPDMIDSYFHDLGGILAGMKQRLTAGGEVALVVADSAYAGIVVPVGTILAELGEVLGYKVYDVEKLRTIKSSPQQGWKPTLKEEVVRLRKPMERRSAG